jgi:hypothetical protein
MIEKCKQHVEKYNIKEGFRVYSLEAYLINKTSGDKRAEQKALEKALDYFTFEDRSAEKANLLYRLGKLTSTEGNRLFEEALRIYEEIYYEKNYLEGSLLTILPQLRY